MSDDEYYYDSPYEDVYDLFDDADPAPELADDLAERAVYSPFWQHTHTGELRDYFSDWDDHSDDYWDDDPKLLNNHENDGRSTKVTKADPRKSTKRGRKRKLSEARDRSATMEESLEALQATLRGTVWKKKSPVVEHNYAKGSDKPTALRLSDSIMRSAYNKTQGFGKGRLKREESWANDLSLADMGLTREATSTSLHNGEVSVDVDADEDEDEDQEEEAEEDRLDLGSDSGMANSDGKEHIKGNSNSGNATILAKRKHGQTLENLVSPEVQMVSDGLIQKQVSRKRQRVLSVGEESKEQVLPSPEISDMSNRTLNTGESTALRSRKRRRKSPEEKTTDLSSKDSVNREDQEQKLPYSSRGRKRKLSPESSEVGSIAKNRAKRSAPGTISR